MQGSGMHYDHSQVQPTSFIPTTMWSLTTLGYNQHHSYLPLCEVWPLSGTTSIIHTYHYVKFDHSRVQPASFIPTTMWSMTTLRHNQHHSYLPLCEVWPLSGTTSIIHTYQYVKYDHSRVQPASFIPTTMWSMTTLRYNQHLSYIPICEVWPLSGTTSIIHTYQYVKYDHSQVQPTSFIHTNDHSQVQPESFIPTNMWSMTTLRYNQHHSYIPICVKYDHSRYNQHHPYIPICEVWPLSGTTSIIHTYQYVKYDHSQVQPQHHSYIPICEVWPLSGTTSIILTYQYVKYDHSRIIHTYQYVKYDHSGTTSIIHTYQYVKGSVEWLDCLFDFFITDVDHRAIIQACRNGPTGF